MTLVNLVGACIIVGLFAAGCRRPADEASRPTPVGSPVAQDALVTDSTSLAEDDPWQGLTRHEIQLDQKLLVVKGSKGVIGCAYLNIGAFERFGEACAIVPAADTAGMLNSKVTAVTSKGKELGIEVGMAGRQALDRIR